MSKKIFFFVITLIALVINTFTIGAVTISGNVHLENENPLYSYIVKINDIEIEVVKSHKFTATVPFARIYQVKITADNYYYSYQTFSHHELENLSKAHPSGNFSLPDFSLVKRKAERVMFAFGGDVMMARRYSKPYFDEPTLIGNENKAEDTKALIQHMKPYMELADYASVNLETQITVTKPKQRAPKSVTFFSPPETLDAIKWAGIDYVTLGNNHIFDYLDEGLISTLKFLDQSGLAYSGAGLNQKQALLPHYEPLANQQYAMLGFVGWKGGFTPNQAAGPSKGGSALGTEENIINTVTAASKKGHPIVVQYHGSLEYSEEPSRMTQSRLKTAIDHGADLVVAHHPHVTQGFEIYKGKLIAYSMGNFIFDQYFHAPPLSYVLYVWMDGEEFHRAEIVPIYLKGYAPIPATGIQRNALIKRTQTLSQKRGISFSTSGGHLVINNKSDEYSNTSDTIVFKAGETLKNIYHFPVSGRIEKVTPDSISMGYRLGENLLNGGDFESYDLFTSDERGWLLNGAKLSKTVANTGSNSVVVDINEGLSSIVGMQTFRRVFNYANPMTYQVKILTKNQPIRAKLYIQFRGKNAKLFDALKSGKKTLLKETILAPSMDWQNFQVDFNTPRVGYRSYRILLEISTVDNGKTSNKIYLDNIALVQWQAHYNTKSSLPADNAILGLATHIGLVSTDDGEQRITLQYKR